MDWPKNSKSAWRVELGCWSKKGMLTKTDFDYKLCSLVSFKFWYLHWSLNHLLCLLIICLKLLHYFLIYWEVGVTASWKCCWRPCIAQFFFFAGFTEYIWLYVLVLIAYYNKMWQLCTKLWLNDCVSGSSHSEYSKFSSRMLCLLPFHGHQGTF